MSYPAAPAPANKVTSPSSSKSTQITGYQNVPLIPFVIGATAAAIPIFLLKMSHQEQWINLYIGVLILSLVVYYWPGLERTSQFVNSMRSSVVKGK